MTSEDVTKLEAADSAVFCPQSRSGMHPKLNRLTDNLRSAIKVQLKPEKKKSGLNRLFFHNCVVCITAMINQVFIIIFLFISNR